MNAGFFAYPWDVKAEGYDHVVGTMAANGMTHVNLATAYHAGKFLLPHNPRSRTYFPEDGSIYFRPDLTRYGRIRPRVNSLVRQRSDPVSSLITANDRHGVGYVAWIVLMHNSWLGLRYPDATVHTAFGDSVMHSLNPSHPDVREYVLALLGDLVSHHNVAAIILESPGYMGYSHGWHHEINGVALDPIQETLMSISFSPHDVAVSAEHGIDAATLRDQVAALLDRAWNQGFALQDADGAHPDAENLLASEAFATYASWQQDQVVSLAQAIRETVTSASPTTEIRHFAALDGGLPDDALLATGDGILTDYATSDDDAGALAESALTHGKPVHGMVRGLPPDTTAPGQITNRVQAWRAAGVDAIECYNYGFMPRCNIEEFYAAVKQQ